MNCLRKLSLVVVTVAVLVIEPLPTAPSSEIVYVNVSTPVNPAGGT